MAKPRVRLVVSELTYAARRSVRVPRMSIATRCGQPAYVGAAPRVTASMIREHGSYDAARAAVVGEGR